MLEKPPPQELCQELIPQMICLTSSLISFKSSVKGSFLMKPTLNISIKWQCLPSSDSPYPALSCLFFHITHHLLTCYTILIYYVYLCLLILSAIGKDLYFLPCCVLCAQSFPWHTANAQWIFTEQMNTGQIAWCPKLTVLFSPTPKYNLGRFPHYPCKYARHSPRYR